MSEDRAYCHYIARRAAARAALHLGIETMTDEALDVVSSCLLDYIERIGKATAATAEASGRSAAHCNVLDVISAVELCDTPAALEGGDVENDDEAQQPHQATDRSWKSLAQFCFGPHWNHSEPMGLGSTGWNVPFPEEIAQFPLAQNAANPHAMEQPALHYCETETVKKDGVATDEPMATETKVVEVWGSLEGGTKKRKAGDDEDQPFQKKMKTIDSNHLDDLPSFYPPLPTLRRTTTTTTTNAVLDEKEEDDEARTVRAALVVPVGRPTTNSDASFIVPINKASISRVSRILEGSMDPAIS